MARQELLVLGNVHDAVAHHNDAGKDQKGLGGFEALIIAM
jgi:hypothetical protein